MEFVYLVQGYCHTYNSDLSYSITPKKAHKKIEDAMKELKLQIEELKEIELYNKGSIDNWEIDIDEEDYYCTIKTPTKFIEMDVMELEV